MAEVDGGLLLEAAQALVRAAEWELADRLLAASGNLDRAERAGQAVTRAQIAVEVRQWRGTGDPAPAIDAAAALPDLPADSGAAFDLDLLRLFRDYWTELVPEGAAPHLGPAGRDPAGLDELRDRAACLVAAAPDRRRSARAAFYAGLIADNLRGEPDLARDLFTRALAACRPGADDDFAAEALRHLGGSALAAGDLETARQQWERSAELAQHAGWLPLVLAQQALLAELAAARGDTAGAGMLAREVGRWAASLGLARLRSQAGAIIPGRLDGRVGGGAGAGRGDAEREEVGDVQGPEDLAFEGADGLPGLVAVQARCGQPDRVPAGVQLAAARGQDVLDPVAVRAIGEGEDVPVLGREDVDRRLVAAARAPAMVDDDAQAGCPRGDVPGDPVQPGLVPARYDPGNRHAAPSAPMWAAMRRPAEVMKLSPYV